MSDPVTGTLGASAVGAGGSILGGIMGSSAQKKAAKQAAAVQMEMFNKLQENLRPYREEGAEALTKFGDLVGTFNFDPTMAQLEQTPGYQFAKTQGMKGVQNAASARGLADSGAALKGAASFATGLADQTFQNQFKNALTSYETNLGGLGQLAGMGQNAAAGIGAGAMQTGQGVASNMIGAGNAAAGNWMNMGNAVGNMANTGANAMWMNQLIQGMYGGNQSGQNLANNGFTNAENQFASNWGGTL